MERAKIATEKNIRASIERTDMEEAVRDIALGRKTKKPTKPQEAYIEDLSNEGVEKRKKAAKIIQKALREKQ